MKKIYIAGPYSADNVMDILHNIRKGIGMSALLLMYGYAPFCPWLDFLFVFFDKDKSLTKQQFYDYSIAWLEVSDGILMIEGWEDSGGSRVEHQIAKENRIPIFYDINELLLYKWNG